MRIEGARIEQVLTPPEGVEALLSGHDHGGPRHQEQQQVELLAGQLDRGVVDPHLAALGIE